MAVLRDAEGPVHRRRLEAVWPDQQQRERCLQTLAEIRLGHVFDTTTLPVAVREVRNLLLASERS